MKSPNPLSYLEVISANLRFYFLFDPPNCTTLGHGYISDLLFHTPTKIQRFDNPKNGLQFG